MPSLTMQLQRSWTGPILILLAACSTASRPNDATSPSSSRLQLEEATIADLQAGLARGTYTSVALTEAYLSRIAKLDREGPALHAFIAVNPDARATAAERDAERRAGRVRGPLHGIPVVIKDNIETADGMATTAGSLALANYKATQDAFLVQRLRAAGAIIIGKTNLSEWANFRSTRSSSGWSAVGGQVRNPYALDRSPCGSSSGTGVAIAANLAAVGIGTETDGSIVCPASANALVGLKPTLGLVSRSGIIPIAHSQDIAGPMARTVADAATLLTVLAGEDPADETTARSAQHRQTDYTRFLDSAGLRGARIGVLRDEVTGYHADVDRLYDAAIAAMRAAGAVIVDSLAVRATPAWAAEFTILLYEFKSDLNTFFAARAGRLPVSSLEQLIEFNERERARSMPFFGQELFRSSQQKGALSDTAYQNALKTAKLAATALDSIMKQHRLDAVVAPTGSPPWLIDLVTGDHFIGGSSSIAAVAGYPTITVPMGFVFGLPVGISFFASAWSEPTLLKLAFAYEQRTRHRVAPRFLPTADLTTR